MSEQLRHKMNNFEVMPPPDSWEAVVARLNDDRQYAAVATKMNNFDTSPPAQIWNNIAASLQETKPATPSLINIRRTLYRVAVAAIIIGLLIGGWMFININNLKIEVAINNSISLPALTATKEDNKITTGNNSTGQKKEVAAVKEQAGQNKTNSRYSLSSSVDNKDRVLKYAIVNSLPAYQESPIIISSSPIPDRDDAVIRSMNVISTGNYLTVTGPNGQSARISSKFANVIRYLNSSSSDDSEEYSDKPINESDTWIKRFQEWRNKISQSSFIPSSANFLDILEFKELIEEKQ